jgi:hypothetical protein
VKIDFVPKGCEAANYWTNDRAEGGKGDEEDRGYQRSQEQEINREHLSQISEYLGPGLHCLSSSSLTKFQGPFDIIHAAALQEYWPCCPSMNQPSAEFGTVLWVKHNASQSYLDSVRATSTEEMDSKKK